MNIADILDPTRITVSTNSSSKKRALETLSEVLADTTPAEVDSVLIFDTLTRRERLGSTGIGSGVAIPHGRIKGLKRTVGGLLKLREGVDYDAPDRQPVDIIFALLVPEHATDEHLRLLSELAEVFSDEGRLHHLRALDDPDRLMDMFRAPPPHAA